MSSYTEIETYLHEKIAAKDALLTKMADYVDLLTAFPPEQLEGSGSFTITVQREWLREARELLTEYRRQQPGAAIAKVGE